MTKSEKKRPYFEKVKIFAFVYFFCVVLSCSDAQSLSDLNHIIHLGQSLGAGEHALPIVTDSASAYGNFSFKMGTHTWKRNYFEAEPEKRYALNFVLVPLRAYERGHEGETIGNGMCDHLKSSYKGNIDKDFHFLFSYTGQGGRLIRELDKKHDDAKDPRAKERQSGGGYYATAIDDVKRAKHSATKKGLSYSVFAITWMQGESNLSGLINRWSKPVEKDSFITTYINDLIQLKRDLQYDIPKITNQQSDIPFFTYQTNGATIGMAQLMACDKEKGMYMVAPTYMMPNGENSRLWNTNEHGNRIHITADGERWLGEMFGKVMRKVIFEKQQWQPLRPDSSWKSDKKTVYVKFHVPSPPLVLDTLLLPKQASGYGFEVYNEKKVYRIKNVAVCDSVTLKIEVLDSLPASGTLNIRYATNSYVKELSQPIIKFSKKDTIINNIPYVSIHFKGNITKELDAISSEGTFRLANRSSKKEELTSTNIRKVFFDVYSGNTILLAETKEWANNSAFKEGQYCYLLRGFAYGNVRDSDQEKSLYSFQDKNYGTRYGQKYPLYNWLVVFEDFKVE